MYTQLIRKQKNSLSFVGPAMSDAISNLGGGGLSTPFLANLATSLNCAAGFVVALCGGPLINKLGIRWSCVLAAITMPLAGSGYYVNARFGVDWYLLFSRVGGFVSVWGLRGRGGGWGVKRLIGCE